MKKSNLVRTIILAGSLLLQLSTLCFHSRGAAGDVDLSFDPGSGVNGPVHAIALQPNGKVIILGEFTTVKGLMRSKIARLNADGSGDSSFNAGTVPAGWGEYTHTVALQADGKVLVGHNNGISRLNSDGSQDTNFNAWIDPICGDAWCFLNVSSIAVQSDGKVLIGGYFSILNGTNVNYGIARLNSNGSGDDSFNPGTGVGVDSHVYSVALQPDGKVLIGGYLDHGIARLNADGSLDNSFSSGAGANSTVESVVVQSDGTVLIGGHFTSVNGTNRNGIARLNADGSLDSNFDPGTGANPFVSEVALQSDGKVLIGGSFTNFNGTTRNSIARLNANGSLDVTFNPGTGVVPTYPSAVSSLVVQSDGKVVIGGGFMTVNGTNRNRIARLNADGSLDSGFYPGRGLLEYPVYTLTVQPDGKVLVNGGIRLNADGSLDNSYVFVPNTNFNPNLAVPGTDYSLAQCSAVQSDGKVLIGGHSYTEVIDSDGAYYPVYSYFLYRFHPDGSRDLTFDPALGEQSYNYIQAIRSLAVQPDGKVLAAGSFNSIKGTNRNGIARLNSNGSLDSSFNPGFPGLYHSVYSMLIRPDGQILVGSWGLARLNSDGSRDHCFNPSIPGNVYSLVVQPDGRVLVGGSFSTVNGVSRNRIARINDNGSLDSSFDPGMGANAAVRAIVLQSDGNVLIAGDFLAVNGVGRPYVARLFGGSSGPRLRVFSTSSSAVIVAWPSPSAGFTLQQNTNLAAPNWVNVATTPASVGLESQVTISAPAGQRFFRLFGTATNPPTPPPPPGPAPTLTATVGDGSVSLSWTTRLGATGHHVQRGTNYNGPFTTIANPGTASYTDTTVFNGTTYYYIVSVIYPCGESANSFPVDATPRVTPTVHVQSITMSFVPQGSRYDTRAVVRVFDNTGAPFNGATVTGNFTGSINDTGRTGATSGNGDATITSSSSIKNGTVTFTVTGIAAGLGYNPAANVVTSATISR